MVIKRTYLYTKFLQRSTPLLLARPFYKYFKPFSIYNIRRKYDKDVKLIETTLKNVNLKIIFQPNFIFAKVFGHFSFSYYLGIGISKYIRFTL